MILLLMTGISLLTMLLKKSIYMTMTVPIVMMHVLQVVLDSYVTIEILIGYEPAGLTVHSPPPPE